MRKLNMLHALLVVLAIILTAASSLAAVSTIYEYDDQYRLTKVNRSDGTTIEYRYDESGNRTRKIVTPDMVKPVINTFVAPSTSSSLTVTGISVSADDNVVGVINYLLTESSSTPSVSDPNWSSSVSQYIFASAGNKTLYSWAKDAASNVSLSMSASIAVRLSQSITNFTPPTSKTYGDADITLSASGGGSGNPVNFSVTSGPGTVSGTNGSTLTITGAGTIVVKASQAGNINYSAATDVTASIAVSPKALTITANSTSRAYGAANPATPSFSAPALVAGNVISGVSYAYAATATATANVGTTHAITPSAAVFTTGSASNYTITYAAGTLTIAGQASQGITNFTPPTSKTYGDADIILSASGGGSGNAVTFSVTSGPGTVSGTNGSTLTITGAGTIVVKASQTGNINYSAATDVSASIAVSPKALTITANSTSRAYGAANPATPGFSAPALVAGNVISGVSYTYAATATATANVGTTHAITPSTAVFTTGSAGNYTITYAPGILSIAGQASQSITNFTPPTSKTYGDADITLSASGGGSGNAVTFSVTSGPGSVSGTNGSTLTITGAGTIVVKASQAGNINYLAAVDVSASIAVYPKALTITANSISRAYGVANPANPGFTAPALFAGNVISGVTYTYQATATATANVGSTHTITPSAAVFTTGAASNYTITYVAGTLTIAGQASQSITNFTPPTSKTYGDAVITLSASGGGSGNPVTFSVTSGPGTVSGTNGSTLTITGAGTIVVKASQAGNINYSAATDVSASIAVSPKALTITASNASRAYGAANPVTPGFTAPVLVTGNVISGVSYTYAATATATANVGTTHAITPSAAVFTTGSAGNYTITYATGTLTIAGQASQSITNFTPPTSKTYGDADITLSASGGGSGNAVTFSITSGPGTVSGSNGSTLTISGTGTIVVKASQAGNTNYAAAGDVTANIVVSPKALTITANSTSRAYGAVNPATPSFSAPALVAGNVISGVTYTYAATATATANVGTTHAITPSAAVFTTGSAGNYTISYAPGTLTIAGQASQTITSFTPPTSKTYGDADITLSASGGGSGNAVTFAIVSGLGTVSGTNGSTLTISGTGTIVVKASQAGNTNYAAAGDVTANIVVSPKAVTVTVSNASRAYGAANPANPGFTAPGLVGTDSIASVTYTYATTATATVNVGTTHSITPSAAVFGTSSGGNYTITYAAGTLTIAGQASQTITGFTAPTGKTYGDTPITLSASGGGSGNPVTFSLVSGPGSVSGTNNATLAITDAGTIVVKASQAGNTNYAAANDVTATIVVFPKALTVTANNASRAYGAGNPESPGFTAPGLVGSDSIRSISYSYATSATATANVGTNHSITPITATFGTGNATNYTISYATGTLTIDGQAKQSITFTPPGTATYGDAPITLSASGGSSGNPVTFSVVSGPGSVSGSTLTITGAGTIIVKSSQAGNTNYSSANDVTASIIVSPKMFKITTNIIGGNGFVGCTSLVVDGSTATCTVSAAGGYQLDSFTDNNIDMKNTIKEENYTIPAVTFDHAIIATFKLIPISGVCGSSNGGTFTVALTANLCSKGTESVITGAGPWNWSCNGQYGGTDATCSASRSKPGDSDGNGSVSIAEVQSAINMFLGLNNVAGYVDMSGDNTVSISEVQKVINGFLGL